MIETHKNNDMYVFEILHACIACLCLDVRILGISGISNSLTSYLGLNLKLLYLVSLGAAAT